MNHDSTSPAVWKVMEIQQRPKAMRSKRMAVEEGFNGRLGSGGGGKFQKPPFKNCARTSQIGIMELQMTIRRDPAKSRLQAHLCIAQ
jgi:hypothetical protein